MPGCCPLKHPNIQSFQSLFHPKPFEWNPSHYCPCISVNPSLTSYKLSCHTKPHINADLCPKIYIIFPSVWWFLAALTLSKSTNQQTDWPKTVQIWHPKLPLNSLRHLALVGTEVDPVQQTSNKTLTKQNLNLISTLILNLNPYSFNPAESALTSHVSNKRPVVSPIRGQNSAW